MFFSEDNKVSTNSLSFLLVANLFVSTEVVEKQITAFICLLLYFLIFDK